MEEEICLLQARNDHPSSCSLDNLSGDEVVVRMVCNLVRVLLACALPMEFLTGWDCVNERF